MDSAENKIIFIQELPELDSGIADCVMGIGSAGDWIGRGFDWQGIRLAGDSIGRGFDWQGIGMAGDGRDRPVRELGLPGIIFEFMGEILL